MFAATLNIKTGKCLFLPIAVTKALRALSIYTARDLSYVYPGTSQGEPRPAPFSGTQCKKQVTIKQQKQLIMAERKKKPPKKKQRYTCKYQDKWTVEYPWVCKSRQGIEHAFCKAKVCVIDIKVDHGGKNDLKKHSITEKHIRLQQSQNTTAPVTNFVLQ